MGHGQSGRALKLLGVSRALLKDCLESVPDLIRFERWDELLLTFQHALGFASSRADGIALQNAMREVPLARRADRAWRRVAARAAYRGGDVKSCEELLAVIEGLPQLEAFRAWVCRERGDHEAALRFCEAAVDSEDQDVVLRVKPVAAVMLRRADWREVFAASLGCLQGRQRGLTLVEFGAFLTYHGEDAAARSAYAESLALLRGDTHFVAHLQYNMAIACLRLDLLDAALEHATLATQHAAHPDGSRLRGRAWSGLGAAGRARGEWPRALHSYANAVRFSTDADDRIQAWRGLACTLRVTGHAAEALTELYEVVKFDPHFNRVWADIAAAKLQTGDRRGALEALEQLGDTALREEGGRVAVVQAELMRTSNRPEQALQTLRAAQIPASVEREERLCFPELFAQHDPGLQPMRVRLILDGSVRVVINDLELTPPLTHREASLLACLVHAQGSLTAERVLDGLEIPGSTERLRSQALSRIRGDLCIALGWTKAISLERARRVYRLDPNVQWDAIYPTMARADAFCDGLNDPWVTDWRHERLLGFASTTIDSK